MPSKLKQVQTVSRQCYALALPYGRKRLLIVFSVILLQGLLQVVGIGSIFPFLALAADPAAFRESSLGSYVEGLAPALGDTQLLLAAGLFSIATLFLSNASILYSELSRARYSQQYGHWLRMRLLRRIVGNPYGYFLQRNTGELLKKVTGDVRVFIQQVLVPLLDLVSRVAIIILILLGLLLVAPAITLFMAVFFGVYYATIFKLFSRRFRDFSDRMKSANRGAMRESQQLLGGIKPVKIQGMEASFFKRIAYHSLEQARVAQWVPILSNTPRYLIEPLAFGSMVTFVLWVAARGGQILDLLPLLGLVALAAYRILPNMQTLYAQLSKISLNQHALEEVVEEFQEVSGRDFDEDVRRWARPEQALSFEQAITGESLVFAYPGAAQAVINGMNLRIEKNSFTAIVGPTGSGKSTLVDLLLGLHTPTSGTLKVDEIELNAGNHRAWQAGIGYVPQDIFLLDDSIAANIAFGHDGEAIDLERVSEVARIAQIADFIEKDLAKGYHTTVGERGVRLSGGQRQRIGLARALYHNPQVLVLDEATSALDNATEAALMEAIEALHGSITLIVIAHRLTTVEKADQVLNLADKHNF